MEKLYSVTAGCNLQHYDAWKKSIMEDTRLQSLLKSKSLYMEHDVPWIHFSLKRTCTVELDNVIARIDHFVFYDDGRDVYLSIAPTDLSTKAKEFKDMMERFPNIDDFVTVVPRVANISGTQESPIFKFVTFDIKCNLL